jgi:hypothetical protein
MLGVRLEIEIEKFFEDGGVTTFIDNMAASLGIHRADLRIVSVYEGSTIIDFEIISNIADEFPLSLDDVEEDFILLMQATEEFMGVPLLGA